ncbi:S9 family peptidase [Pseudoalteromonas sp. SCSIO 43088]|uniref:S9 family peptidase n=1 Tax=Pseudoalteromonas sp. SCSIO 43088 TaxID=2822846 RepID=UPI00202B57B1|nr:prolyl oligopeptidase family serine peptidase [Pseudoalteromonas sp. SCSIO 43088]URQ85575.1 S9 family peptidase [Pseudoalteromonas sp. SCSIO 43088]
MKLTPFSRLLFPVCALALSGNVYAEQSLVSPDASAEKRPLALEDIMKFKSIVAPQITKKGNWIGFVAKPDRGDSTYHIQSTTSDVHYQVALGSKATFSADGRFIAVVVKPELLISEQADKKAKKKLKNNLVVIELASGKRQQFDAVESYALSDNFGYLAFASKQAEKEKDEQDKTAQKIEAEATAKTEPKEEKESEKLFNKKRINFDVTLVKLADFSEQTFTDVDRFSFSAKAPLFAYSTSTKDGIGNQLQVLNLNDNKTELLVDEDKHSFSQLTWGKEGKQLAFLQGSFADEKETRSHAVKIWSSKRNKVTKVKNNFADWFVSDVYKPTWSEDNKRVFLGLKPVIAKVDEVSTKPENEADLYNTDKLVAGRNLQIWHGDDALIKTNEKYQIKQDKKHSYRAVYHTKSKKLVQLADSELIRVNSTNNANAVIGSSDIKYRKLRTWEGFFSDFYIVDLKTGKKSLIAEKLSSYTPVKLSASGRYAAFYKDQAIWAFDRKYNRTINLTYKLDNGFANEDHDRPSKVSGYGIAGWLEGDEGVLVYDKFDVWQLSLNLDDAKCLTCEVGRPNARQFRIVDLDKKQDFFNEGLTLLLTSYNDDLKNYGFYQLDLETGKLSKQREENKKFKFVAKAEEADKLLFTREDFNEFPDLWVSDLNTKNGTKLTQVNPQKDEFLWGNSELVEWRSAMGVKHQGVLIKPANYVEGQKYPVVVYYYRRFSQRLYEFNAMKVNHRPNFPYYTSNGYAIFLPDVHFEVGTPGHSTNKSILPGIEKIIDMGVADENAIGLHGHSWSGYQTLHSITQTDVFAAAVSGAPVSNMTSAYSGIRLGTGLARQFQYETGQSRIGASLFERRDLYIENSPVFFADRINTPLLMQFGDIDDAVPWQQGVEMYLAMRRLDKNVILLQYEGEPHHLKKYPNKVDYTIKMKEYFDHYLKGAPAAKWMVEGEAYREKKAK